MLSKDYMAGFFDGEGSIGIYGTSNDHTHKASLIVQLVQNDGPESRPLLNEFEDRYGGNITEIPPVDRMKLNWFVSGERACLFLEDLIPHLRLKLPQAIVGTEWYRNRQPLCRNAKGQIVKRPPEQIEYDRIAMAEMKRLKNKKGA